MSRYRPVGGGLLFAFLLVSLAGFTAGAGGPAHEAAAGPAADTSGVIQVPDQCAGRESPCLIRVGPRAFEFEDHGLKLRILPQAIVKLTAGTADGALALEVYEGRVHVTPVEGALKRNLTVQQLAQPAAALLVSRFGDRLRILRLNDFVLGDYEIQLKEPPRQIRSGFATKKDFVDFTRFYFQAAGEFKAFLNRQGEAWKSEFQRQNAVQTKVLNRSVASVQNEADASARAEAARARDSKKVREQFFYRTFHR